MKSLQIRLKHLFSKTFLPIVRYRLKVYQNINFYRIRL